MSSENLYEILRRGFPSDPGHAVIETPEARRWSYGELERETGRLASFLAGLGVAPGERVAVQVDKSPEALFLYLACLRAGLVYLPLNTAYQPQELDYFIDNAEPAVVVCRPQDAALVGGIAARHGVAHTLTLDAGGGGSLVEESHGAPTDFATVPRSGGDLAAILYSSGTTGKPKGVMITHANLASNAAALHRAWGFRPGDVLLHALPLFHVHGLFVASHCALLNGSTMLFLPRYDAPLVMELLPRATVFMGVPTYYTRLLARPEFGRETCRHVRLFVSGSAPLLEQTFAEFRERTGQTILERYGMTETGMNTSNPLDGERRAGTVGLPLPGVEVRIAGDGDRPLAAGEVGEIQLKGPNVFKGYWRMPEKTAEDFTADGWFRSGDLGRFDADGYLAIVGRSKDLVISGGYNVYPKEVELVIDALDGVQESAVFGVPHPDFGEAVAAAVVRAAGGEDLTAETLIERLKAELANYKVPKRVEFVDSLPRNTMGKVQKNLLRERYG